MKKFLGLRTVWAWNRLCQARTKNRYLNKYSNIYYFIVFADSLVRGIQIDAYVDAHNRASSAKLGLYDFTNEHAELSEQCARVQHQIGKISPSYKPCAITQKRPSTDPPLFNFSDMPICFRWGLVIIVHSMSIVNVLVVWRWKFNPKN